MSRANAKSSQLGRSQRAIGVGDGREDGNVGELLERLVPLAVNDLLVAPHNLKALISAPACGKDTMELLQDVGVGSRSKGGTTTVGSARRGSSRSSRKTSTRDPWIPSVTPHVSKPHDYVNHMFMRP
jgi:hypothetical protein